MDLDELEPREPAKGPKDLSTLSVAELEDYIARLQAEIARAQEAISAKRAVRAGADSLFRR